MSPTLCPSCGEPAEGRFCGFCGTEIAMTRPVLRYRISTARVTTMCVISGGLYFIYWFYLTWKQYRDQTGEEAYPVWHALTLFVPIYALFRVHAHFRSFLELMHRREVDSSLIPAYAVIVAIITSVLGSIGLRLSFGEVTQGAVTAIFIADVISTVITLALLIHAQENLNRVWDRFKDCDVQEARIGVGEVIFAILGVLFWIDTYFRLTSESYRMGF